MTYTIDNLLILKFIKVIETSDASLILKYRPNNKYLRRFYIWLFRIDLVKDWENIQKEYEKHSENPRSKKVSQLQTKLSKLVGKYYAIIACLEVLKYGSDDDMLKILKDYGYSINGDYWEGIEIIYKQVSNLKRKIEGVENEIKGYMDVGSDKEINIFEIITNLSLGLETSLKASELTVIEYIFYRKALVKKIKQQK